MKTLAKQLLCHAISLLGPHRLPSREPRLWILTYHRILPAEDPRSRTEEPGMVVTPETFRRHIDWIRAHMPIVQLRDWVQAARAGRDVPRKACAITFDDGWLDNYEYAWPILRETATPASVFVVSHMIGTSERFWPNRLLDLLQRASSEELRDEAFDWLRVVAPFELMPKPNAEQRAALLVACKRLSEIEVRGHIDRLEARFPPASNGPVLVDWTQLKEMFGSGLVDVGSHTCRHYRLGMDLPQAMLELEIRDSRARLEQALGRDIPLFCYPYGEVNDRAERVVGSNYEAGLSSRPGINRAWHGRFAALSRIGLHEDISRTRESFLARLSGWI